MCVRTAPRRPAARVCVRPASCTAAQRFSSLLFCTETSAEVLSVRPGGCMRMVSKAGRFTAVVQGGHLPQTAAQGTPPPGISTPAPPHQPPLSASEGIGGARGLGNLVRPESHPEPRRMRFPGAVGRPGGQAGDQNPPIAPRHDSLATLPLYHALKPDCLKISISHFRLLFSARTPNRRRPLQSGALEPTVV